MEAATAVALTVLGSGSSGNAALLSAGDTHLLIDAGLSRRKLRQRLEEAGVAINGLAGILLTHEHADHAAHAGKVSSEFGCPIYLSHGTSEMLEREEKLERRECFRPGAAFEIGGVKVTPFSVPHDAREPVGFRFEAEGVRITYVLDLGILTTLVKEYLRECDGILVEANHDLELLRRGPYPWHIKQRVMGRTGHLSNEALKEFIESDFDGAARHLVLAHLSENNNSPELAQIAIDEGLKARRKRFPMSVKDELQVHVCPRTAHLPTLRF